MSDSNIQTIKSKKKIAFYHDELINNFNIEMLNIDYWAQKNAIVGSAQGRGTTYFVSHNDAQWVLKHYYRGGLIGKFNKDLYLFDSVVTTRASLEFNLLNKMHHDDLPVPAPIACLIEKVGIFYRADILTSRIENAQDLVAILEKETLSDTLWQKIGQTIKAFHLQGIYHDDLNAHNILIDDNQKVWLIDFDKGNYQGKQSHENCADQSSWQAANLARLLRSFNKEKQKLPQFLWQEEHWQQLLLGYQHIS